MPMTTIGGMKGGAADPFAQPALTNALRLGSMFASMSPAGTRGGLVDEKGNRDPGPAASAPNADATEGRPVKSPHALAQPNEGGAMPGGAVPVMTDMTGKSTPSPSTTGSAIAHTGNPFHAAQ